MMNEYVAISKMGNVCFIGNIESREGSCIVLKNAIGIAEDYDGVSSSYFANYGPLNKNFYKLEYYGTLSLLYVSDESILYLTDIAEKKFKSILPYKKLKIIEEKV